MVISRVISKQVQNPLVDEAEQPSTNFVKLESVTVVLISWDQIVFVDVEEDHGRQN